MHRPSLVLLHGVGLDRSVWEPVAEILEARFDVLALDLPGHGTRPPVADGATLADLADDVAERMPAGAHLVGFSLGAMIAQQLAIHRPDLVATLTSVSSVCDRTDEERAAVLDRLRLAEEDFTASARASLDRWFEGTDVSAARVLRTSEVLLSNDVDSFLRCYRVFATADAELAPRLGSITAPALAVTGGADPGSTPEMTHRLAAAIPGCREEVISAARHMLPLQCPGALAASITTFIGDRSHV